MRCCFFWGGGRGVLRRSAIAHLHACGNHLISYALSYHMQIPFNNLYFWLSGQTVNNDSLFILSLCHLWFYGLLSFPLNHLPLSLFSYPHTGVACYSSFLSLVSKIIPSFTALGLSYIHFWKCIHQLFINTLFNGLTIFSCLFFSFWVVVISNT